MYGNTPPYYTDSSKTSLTFYNEAEQHQGNYKYLFLSDYVGEERSDVFELELNSPSSIVDTNEITLYILDVFR